MKRVLILCTGNSCRSIIAEALINKHFSNIEAYSSGVAPSGRVNPNAIKVLQEHECWSDDYHSKQLDEVIDIEFDLVVTVCDGAKENCPIFPSPIPTVHIGFEDPDGREYEAFVETYEQIESILLPRVEAILNGDVDRLSSDDKICYCIGVTKGEIVDAIRGGAETLQMVRDITKACTGSSCETTNPLKRCCSKEIKKLIERECKPMKKNLFKTTDGVKISFSGAVAKEQITKMVANCATGQCECMSDETKSKIKDMRVDGEDGAVDLNLTGDIATKEIEEALSRSKVINGTSS